jgi:hypothetical protein
MASNGSTMSGAMIRYLIRGRSSIALDIFLRLAKDMQPHW